MKNHIIIFFALAFNLLFSEAYQDRFLIYINNSVDDFKIDSETGLTNNKTINGLLKDVQYEKIFPWLPNARPSDKDGDVYLDRYL